MSLIDKLLSRTQPAGEGRQRVFARVLLDEAGRVQAVQLKRSCGDPAIDERALVELQNNRYPANRIGSKTSRRWHDVAWSGGE
ncbi:energy transducer TonB [Paraburkholderia heleia]|uniref:energy transducer TonB n=1 Tax=Paraburkholderia heleia TaxID=634127 RepID=UPI002AB6BF8C|nr:energy transducer TonB [Paraburkholderia heleia]